MKFYINTIDYKKLYFKEVKKNKKIKNDKKKMKDIIIKLIDIIFLFKNNKIDKYNL